MPRMLDEFDTGKDVLDLPRGGGFIERCQSGTMVGGGRRVALGVLFDPRDEPSHLDLGTGTLDLSLGAEQFGRVDITYGFGSDGAGGCRRVPLAGADADFASNGSVIRTNVRSANTLFAINFNIVAFTATGRAQAGQNMPASTRPFSVDCRFAGERKSERETLFVPATGEADFGRVGALVFIFQTSGSLVVDSFEVV